jgi:hypothetical protein
MILDRHDRTQQVQSLVEPFALSVTRGRRAAYGRLVLLCHNRTLAPALPQQGYCPSLAISSKLKR